MSCSRRNGPRENGRVSGPRQGTASKLFENELCVYCSKDPACTADQVFSPGFFFVPLQAQGPTAPTCARCKGEKLNLERCLTGKSEYLDEAILERFFTLITRALVWFHWNIYLSEDKHVIRSFSVIAVPPQLVDEMFFGSEDREHVVENLQGSGPAYKGKKDRDDPTFTTWQFSLSFAGLGNGSDSGPVYVLTGPKSDC